MLVEYLSHRLHMTQRDIRRVLFAGFFAFFTLIIVLMEHATSSPVEPKSWYHDSNLENAVGVVVPLETQTEQYELDEVLKDNEETVLFFSVSHNPFTLTWQVAPSTEENYEVEICERGGFRCSKYIEVTCINNSACQVLHRKSYKLTETYIREHRSSDSLDTDYNPSQPSSTVGIKTLTFVDKLYPHLETSSYLRIRSYSDSTIGQWKTSLE